ncbi:hypothetical protein [Campylobacter sp. MIT 97-5078]|uniref:hypothetical protein n=1 Tax=Campylobacter sp. MIT 97-5078 TaxID=1548153 RepID=UPI0005140A98|nr:hypothetical protein [Campylobacter sp. MIT 97-5078]KGI56138.1 hypothetical protein LR59_08665 [Campylobacter sp. MIT 97-5078]
MLKGLKDIIIFLFYLVSGISALWNSIMMAISYYQFKKGAIFDFLKFMSLEHSILVAIFIKFIISCKIGITDALKRKINITNTKIKNERY